MGSLRLKVALLYFLYWYIQVDGGTWPLPWSIPSIPTLGLCLHDNKIKTKVAWLLPEETMLVWPLLSYFTKRWCKSVTFTIFPPNLSVSVYDFMVSECTGKNKVLACFTLLVQWVNASDPVLTLTVFSPKRVHPGSPAAVLCHFSDTFQHVERDSLWL